MNLEFLRNDLNHSENNEREYFLIIPGKNNKFFLNEVKNVITTVKKNSQFFNNGTFQQFLNNSVKICSLILILMCRCKKNMFLNFHLLFEYF